MEQLAAILRAEGIDTASLRLLYQLHGDVVYALTAGGYDALDLWEKLAGLVPTTGRWPLIVGAAGAEDVPTERITHVCENGRYREQKQRYPDTPMILAQAEAIDAEALLAQWQRVTVGGITDSLKRALEEGYEEDAEHWRTLLAQPEEFQGTDRGEWPEEAEPSSPWSIGASVTHDSDFRERAVTIALLPTPHGWHAPAVWKFGNFNSCPPPHEHAALLRHWEGKYGARVVVLTEDVLECLVARPPPTKEEALLLARDHFLYCSDIVSQGAGSLDALAAPLLRGEAWYFWWD